MQTSKNATHTYQLLHKNTFIHMQKSISNLKILSLLSHCVEVKSLNYKQKKSAYGRHWLSQRVQIIASSILDVNFERKFWKSIFM